MRNDQIAVLLRDFANRCIQWALVLEKEGETPFPDVPVKLPDAATVAERIPSPSAASGTFLCPGIGEPGDHELYVASHSASWHLQERGPWPGALCASCYGLIARAKRVVGSR